MRHGRLRSNSVGLGVCSDSEDGKTKSKGTTMGVGRGMSQMVLGNVIEPNGACRAESAGLEIQGGV